MAVADPSRSRGQLFVIAAPSGAGKTSLVKALLARKPELRALHLPHHAPAARRPRSTAASTTSCRSRNSASASARGQFLEHAQVFDNYYGTGRGPVEAQLAQGRDVILEIDWQGARQVREALPECLHDLHPAALAPGPGGAPAQPPDGFRRGHRPPPARRRRGYVALERVRLRGRQRRLRAGGRATSRASSKAGGAPLGARPTWPAAARPLLRPTLLA